MKKLNDLKCSKCGELKRDVFTETFDGRETVAGPDGESVVAICNRCGTELKKVLTLFNIGVRATSEQKERCSGYSPESLMGASLFTVGNPITGDTFTPVVESVKVVDEHGPLRIVDCSCKLRRGVMPNKLN